MMTHSWVEESPVLDVSILSLFCKIPGHNQQYCNSAMILSIDFVDSCSSTNITSGVSDSSLLDFDCWLIKTISLARFVGYGFID
jgi:hypothetical protein